LKVNVFKFTVGNGLDRSVQPSQRAKPVKRAQWAKQRAGFGAAVKIFKAYAAEYFGYRKSTGGTATP